jgi:KDO2-lipid IV(A) lauroyltransferase
MGDAVYLCARRSRKIVADNVRRVFGADVDERTIVRLTRETYRNLARNYYDLMRIPHLSRERLERMVVFEGLNHYEEARSSAAGVVLASAHIGNLDLVTQAAGLIDMPMTVLAERLRPERLHNLVMSLRGDQGRSFEAAGARGVKAAFQVLTRGEFVGVATDRAIQGHGVVTELFGEPALMPDGAAQLALRAGATILPGYSIRKGRDRYLVRFEAPIYVAKNRHAPDQVKELTDKIIEVMEGYIRAYPGQWMAFEPIWGPRSDNGTAHGEQPVVRAA